MVQRIGHEVADSVTMGEEAVEIVNNGNIDLILMDIMLEGKIDGIDAMKQIRNYSDVPVIYVTGNSDQTTIKRAKETSYVAYLVKPIVLDQLKNSIGQVS